MTLKKWRLAAALLVLGVSVSLFLLPSRWTAGERAFLLGFQFTPGTSRLGSGLAVSAAILFSALLLGRAYCSVACPAGLVQELFHRLGRRLRLGRLRHARSGHPLLLLFGAGASAVSGLVLAANFLDPLGLFGRLAATPRPAWPPDGLAGLAFAALLIAGAVLLVAAPLFKGRWFCDRLCPVGALLGFAASAGGRGLAVDAGGCMSCGRCETVCPTRAVDAKGKRIDPARCVLCLECPDACPAGAIAFRNRVPERRRDFLHSLAVATAAGLYALARPLGLGLGMAVDGGTPDVAPPGSHGSGNHRARCVSCQACVLACPVGIIRIRKPDLRPTLDYADGFCQYDCVACTASCPAGVLSPLAPAEKQRTRIARTELALERCVVKTAGSSCGACAEVCPTHAVRMREQGEGLPTLPDFAAEYCIGCGACFHVCPVEPRAFTVSGLIRHETSAGVRPGGHAENAPSSADNDGTTGGAEPQEFPF